ncbi:MAG: Rieske (2Fe-2S) protein [Halomonas sp.]|uniref:Rieske (2Fe-2S) protein n=1 Tax=Halomonas sp. TaxID=1486246 RepID=UPI002ACD6754|nr:Rieske (2Fe-2S) protein [Halomonas sp.]MDZ7853885.1 Rieske (2Fe-2S) protein [Halomonas sp.]
MTQAWKQYRSAPAMGTPVARLEELPRHGTLSVSLTGEKGSFPLLLIHLDDGSLLAYVNACPHQYLPLDQRGKRVLSQDGERLRCTNHEASFATRTGEGVAGLGLDCALDPVLVHADDQGWLVIGE